MLLRLSKLNFDVAHKAGLEHQVAYVLSRLRTAAEKTNRLEDEIFVCNVKDIKGMSYERPYVQVCTDCHVENDLKTDKSDEFLNKKGKSRVCLVQPTVCQTKKGDVSTIDELASDQKKDAYCCGDTTQIGMS